MLDHLIPLLSSPWLYVIVAGLVAVDGVLPVVPAETVVIGLGAFSVGGEPNVVCLVTAVAVGAALGNGLSYGLGGRAARRCGPAGRGAIGTALLCARGALLRHGGAAIVVGHFLPGGRAATTITAGSVRYPLRRFWFFSALAAVAWAGYVTGLGYLGGLAFTDRPLLGALPGFLLGLAVTITVAARRRRRVAAEAAAATAATVAAPQPTRGVPLRVGQAVPSLAGR